MTCPICKRPASDDYRPFCSKRCADVDLARWMGGHYALPSTDPDDADALQEALSEALDQAARSPDGKPH